MQIILSKNCESFTGKIGHYGYHIQQRKNGFFAKRNSKGLVLPTDHWNFILACIEIVQARIYFSDIILPADELRDALNEANIECPVLATSKSEFHARDILDLTKNLPFVQ